MNKTHYNALKLYNALDTSLASVKMRGGVKIRGIEKFRLRGPSPYLAHRSNSGYDSNLGHFEKMPY